MSSIIQVRDLSKSYTIAHEGRQGYTALRDVMAQKAKKIFSFPKSLSPTTVTKEEFWALKDINFEVEKGDRLGIIGRNGAGKSTLLKLLSRITEPTTGSISIRGRVASLLEVGTGFHPELTGRENIYLNGAILGMSRVEIKKKFEEIVDFAEVEKFLDTPVKRYSSGMYVRLAFSVAAHLEPEILIVDEVLAVGDAQFQKKCLGKMEEVSVNEGRTVLFVSHSMPTISSLCGRCILLDQGKIAINGETSLAVLSYYNTNLVSATLVDYSQKEKLPGDQFAKLLKFYVQVKGEIAKHEINIEDEIELVIEYIILQEEDKLYAYPNFHVYNAAGICVFISTPDHTDIHSKGKYRSVCKIPGNMLNEGTYSIGVAVSSFGKGVLVHLFEQNAITFNIKDNIYGVPTRLQVNGIVAYSGEFPGTMRPLLNWRSEQIS